VSLVQNSSMHFRFVLLTLALFAAFAGGVLACSCYEQSPVCEAYGDAKAVFVGEVVEGQSPERMSDLRSLGTGQRPFVLNVKEAFLGPKTGSKISVFTGSGFGDCGFPFQKGETYLLYAYESKGVLTTSICTRSAHISRVNNEDFEFLRNLKEYPEGARLFGKVDLYAKSSFEKDYIEAAKNLRIDVTSLSVPPKRYRLYTDKSGKYELLGLAAGRYRITPRLPKHVESDELDDEYFEFELNNKGCYKQDFTLKNESEVGVKVIDAEGNPVKNIWVEFVPLSVTVRPENVFIIKEFGVTNPQGGLYEFNLPPGSYTVSVNYFHAPNKEYPYPATFLPGTMDRSKAQVIEIKPGVEIRNLVIQLPQKLASFAVTGEVHWPDGTPASNVEIFLEDESNKGFCVDGCDQMTSQNGSYKLFGYKGQRYRIEARIGDGDSRRTAESLPFQLDRNISIPKLVLSGSKDQ